MTSTSFPALTLCLATFVLMFLPAFQDEAPSKESESVTTLPLHYLEIVTTDQKATCDLLSKLHGVTFGDPQLALGNARTAKLADGAQIGVREPMHGAELPAVRPYVLVDDVDAAFEQAKTAGAEVMVPPMTIEGSGRFCLYLLGGNQHGVWQR